MTAPAKPRRHFIAWSPQFRRAFCAETKADVITLVCTWCSNVDGRKWTWRQLRPVEGWRVTEVSE